METHAQRIHQFGDPSVITFESVTLPRPGPQEVLVRVEAAGVGPWDALVRTGTSGLPQPLPLTLGSDLAGTVLDAGIDAGHLVAGVEVYGMTNARFVGAYARHAIVDAWRLARKPARLTFTDAASLPVIAVTAHEMLFERGRLQRGQRVLVHGAAGSVGSLAVRMAHAAGAVVTALGDADDAAYLRGIGADTVLDYTAQPFERAAGQVDLVVDTLGGEFQQRSFGAIARGGALISIVQPPDPALAERAGVRAEFFIVDVTAERLDRLAPLVEDGTIVANVGLVLPLADARRAHELLAQRNKPFRGKMVLSNG